jgi:hypothetical protein
MNILMQKDWVVAQKVWVGKDNSVGSVQQDRDKCQTVVRVCFST